MNANTEIKIVPLHKLHLSPMNVRKTRPKGSPTIDELAANIKANSIIHNLVVVPEVVNGRRGLGVVVGGRRLTALSLLLKRKEIPKDYPVPVKQIAKAEAVAISLSENIHREAMHPADEFEAWAALVDAGKSAEEIAAANGVTPATVERRLRLARVSPLVLKLYRADELNLDQVMAFTLTDDHAAQDVLLKGRRHYPQAYEIRRALTETSVPASDVRARFIGEKAYLDAGGTVRRDMFDERNGAYFENPQLVEQLVTAKLERAAERLRRDFAWVDIIPSRVDYSERSKFGSVPSVRREPDAKTGKKLDKLNAELDAAVLAMQAIENAPETDDSEAQWAEAEERHDAIEAKIAVIEEGLLEPDPEAAPLAGAIIGIGHDGRIEKYVNLIRPEDKAKVRKGKGRADDAGISEDEDADALADPQSVRTDLSTYLTAITQEALAENIPLALRALAFQLASSFADGYAETHGVGVRMEDHADLPVSETLAGSAIEAQRRQRQAQWEANLPEGDALWAWCQSADDHTIASLLAYCTARSLAGTQFHAGSQVMRPLIDALGIDLTAHWQPAAAYFKRIKKATTVSVLAAHGHTAPELAKAKRDALADRAEQLLAGSGWLAPTLRPQSRD